MTQPEPARPPELAPAAEQGPAVAADDRDGAVRAWCCGRCSGAVSWAVFMAIVFSSLQERSVLVCRGRRGWAAFGTLVVIIVSVLLPTALLTASITQEAAAFYERFKSGDIQLSQYFQRGIDALPAWVRTVLDRFDLADLGAGAAQAGGRAGAQQPGPDLARLQHRAEHAGIRGQPVRDAVPAVLPAARRQGPVGRRPRAPCR